MKISLDTETIRIIDIAEDAGKSIMNIYEKNLFGQQLKSDNSPLTKADIASHNIIINSLKKIDPMIPILSEESCDIAWNERKYWLIDPLDGTKEFINKNGEFTVNIALIDNHIPVFGVMYAPAINETWVGSNKKNLAVKISNGYLGYIQVKPHKKSKVWRVVVSRSHAGNSPKKYLDKLGNHKLISMGSSIKLCLVAESSAHIYPRLAPTSEWDTATHAVVNATGGKIINVENNASLEYNKKDTLLNPHFIMYPD